MDQTSVCYGVGELGGVFARGMLRLGSTVVPVIRELDPADVAASHPDPEVVVVTVGEADLDPVLATMPTLWQDRVALVQNELLPRTWQSHGLDDATVAVVWFEKKKGRPVTQIIPTPVFGPHASYLAAALGAIDIATELVTDQDRQLLEMVAKNLYILTANIAGLDTGGTVGELWEHHRGLAQRVAGDVLDIQEALIGSTVDRNAATDRMLEAFAGDPEHGTTGRSAPARLRRAIGHADEYGIAAPALRDISARHLD